jgi:hypothetical protein
MNLELYAIFEDDPGKPVFTSVHVDHVALAGRDPKAGFMEAIITETLLGRPLRLMWLLDTQHEHGPVVKVYAPGGGNVPVHTIPDTEWFT